MKKENNFLDDIAEPFVVFGYVPDWMAYAAGIVLILNGCF